MSENQTIKVLGWNQQSITIAPENVKRTVVLESIILSYESSLWYSMAKHGYAIENGELTRSWKEKYITWLDVYVFHRFVRRWEKN